MTLTVSKPNEDSIQPTKETSVMRWAQLARVDRCYDKEPKRSHACKEAAGQEHADVPRSDYERPAEKAQDSVVVHANFPTGLRNYQPSDKLFRSIRKLTLSITTAVKIVLTAAPAWKTPDIAPTVLSRLPTTLPSALRRPMYSRNDGCPRVTEMTEAG